MSLFKDKATWC